MTETDTPRTDWARQISPQAVILEAEKLERENAELREALSAANAKLCLVKCPHCGMVYDYRSPTTEHTTGVPLPMA